MGLDFLSNGKETYVKLTPVLLLVLRNALKETEEEMDAVNPHHFCGSESCCDYNCVVFDDLSKMRWELKSILNRVDSGEKE